MKNKRLGEEKCNNQGYLMKIIKYNNAMDIMIEFQDKYKTKVKTQYGHFQTGKIKNPYHPLIFNIGYIGQGKYSYAKHKKIYRIWHHMLKRCYDPYYINKYPTYTDCYVCEEWHNFQNFAKWCEENYYEIKGEIMCLDKDILFKNNKIYSPQTCIFAPNKINTLFIKSDKIRGRYPIGVRHHNKNKSLIANCRIYKNDERKVEYLGSFPSNKPFQAFTCYKQFKENYIKQVADEYKDLIPIELYEAMYRYEVEIND